MPKGSPFTEQEIAVIVSAICFFKSEGEKCKCEEVSAAQESFTMSRNIVVSMKRIGAWNKKEDQENPSLT